jgi:hypothetical protein
MDGWGLTYDQLIISVLFVFACLAGNLGTAGISAFTLTVIIR